MRLAVGKSKSANKSDIIRKEVTEKIEKSLREKYTKNNNRAKFR